MPSEFDVDPDGEKEKKRSIPAEATTTSILPKVAIIVS